MGCGRAAEEGGRAAEEGGRKREEVELRSEVEVQTDFTIFYDENRDSPDRDMVNPPSED